MAERLKDQDRGIRLEADLKASAAVTKQAGLTWPMPADRRLDQLVELANEAGAGTRRNELAAAIVAAAEADGEVLLRPVLQWRRSKVRDVIVNPPEESSVIHFPRYGPGRRKADASSLPAGRWREQPSPIAFSRTGRTVPDRGDNRPELVSVDSSVVPELTCPASRAISSTATPDSDITERNVCRSSRGAQTPSMPAFLHRVRKSRRTCEASGGVPTLVVNTRPVSCHSSPAASRLRGEDRQTGFVRSVP